MKQLNKQEQKLVTDHIHLVNLTIRNNVLINEAIQGLGYDDLYQTACEALCHAAIAYRHNKGTTFYTFAIKVIRNSLISSCRKATRYQKPITTYLDAPVDATGDNNMTYAQILADEKQTLPDGSDNFVLSLLKDAETRYNGSVKKGIQALFLRCLGHGNLDIAAFYNVKPNLVAAWISKATARLRQDEQFIYRLQP